MEEKKDVPLVVKNGDTLVIESTVSWGNDAKVTCMEVIPAATAVKDNASTRQGLDMDWTMVFGSADEEASARAAVENTDFEGAGPVHDWRNHVPHALRPIWSALSVDAKLAVQYMAEREADNELWD